MSHRHIVLSVLFFREQHDSNTWIAQVLEHDIAASGEDVEQAKLALERTLSGYLQLAEQRGQEPFATLSQAPTMFWEIWNRVASQRVSAERITSAPAFMVPVVTHEPLQAAH